MDKINKLNYKLYAYEEPTIFRQKLINFHDNDSDFNEFDSSIILNEYEGFRSNNCFDSSANPMDPRSCMRDISNNLFALTNQSKYQKHENNMYIIDDNYNQLERDLKNYSDANANSYLYDSIDSSGNLLHNEGDDTIRDGLLKDTKEKMLQQNNMYLIGTFFVTSVLVLMVVVK